MGFFELKLGFLHIFVYGTFLYKHTKNTCRYYYIWFPAIVAWIHDGLNFFYTFYHQPATSTNEGIQQQQNNSDDVAIPYNIELLLLKAALTWFAIAMYWTRLDKKELSKSDTAASTPLITNQLEINPSDFYQKCAKPLFYSTVAHAISESIVISTGNKVRSADMNDPTPYKLMVTSFMCGITLLFLITIWWRYNNTKSSSTEPSSSTMVSSAKNNPALLMYGCFLTLQPLQTTYEIIVLLLRKYIFAIPSIGWFMAFLSFVVSRTEGMIILYTFPAGKDALLAWPEFKSDNIVLLQRHQQPTTLEQDIKLSISSYNDDKQSSAYNNTLDRRNDTELLNKS